MDAAGEQRIVREVDARDDVGHTEGHLLRFREEVVGVAVENHSTDRDNRNELLRDNLRRVEHVEREFLRLFFSKDLKAQLPLGIGTCLNGLPKIAAVEV